MSIPALCMSLALMEEAITLVAVSLSIHNPCSTVHRTSPFLGPTNTNCNAPHVGSLDDDDDDDDEVHPNVSFYLHIRV